MHEEAKKALPPPDVHDVVKEHLSMMEKMGGVSPTQVNKKSNSLFGKKNNGVS